MVLAGAVAGAAELAAAELDAGADDVAGGADGGVIVTLAERQNVSANWMVAA